LPISSLGLDYPVTTERVSSGIATLDAMFGGKGYYRGSSVLISGTAGTGKSSLAAAFADSVCRRGDRCLYFSFEESPEQIARNMASIGIDLVNWVDKGLLRFVAKRPTQFGLEAHLVGLHVAVTDFKPVAVVMDPITSMSSIGETEQIKAMLTRLIDFLKQERITGVITSLTTGGAPLEQSEATISSLMDTWIILRSDESGGERRRLLYVLKSRGMAHSSRVRQLYLTDHGIEMADTTM
jgi:circadian clock protein KaiC